MRIPLRPLRGYPWYLRLFFRHQERKYGQVLKPAMLWGRVPKLFMAVATLYGVIDRRGSPLEPALRSLVTVRVSQMNWCRFCVDINSATLAARAGSMAKVEALEAWRESDLFDEKEKAALEYAEAMTDSNLAVTDQMIEQLRRFFDEDAIVELTGLIAFQNLSSKFNAALDAPVQGFCRLPSPSRATPPGEY